MAKAKKKVASKKAAPKKSGASKSQATKKVVQKKTNSKAKKPVKKAAPKKAVKAAKAAKKATVKKASQVVKKGAAKAAVKKAAAQKTASKVKPQASAPAKVSGNKAVIAFQKNLTPLDDRILVTVKGVEKKTPGGLIIPDTVADQSGNLQGIVVASGRGHLSKKGRIRPMDVHQGDQVLFSEYSGTKVQLDGEDFVIIRESDVLGILQK